MTPEEKARRDIDRQLDQSGWIVQNRAEMNISAGPGVAVREYPMLTGEADYLLYAGGKAIGVVEAKPRGHALIGVETQTAKYAGALPPGVPNHGSPPAVRIRERPARSRSSPTCSNPSRGVGRFSASTGPRSCSA